MTELGRRRYSRTGPDLVYIDDLGRQWDSAGQVIKVLDPSHRRQLRLCHCRSWAHSTFPDPNWLWRFADQGRNRGLVCRTLHQQLRIQLQRPEHFRHCHWSAPSPTPTTWLIDNVTGYDTADFHFLRDDDDRFLWAPTGPNKRRSMSCNSCLSGHPFPDLSATVQYHVQQFARDWEWNFEVQADNGLCARSGPAVR